ncbi:solute carrier family 22 member 7-like isoform X5 [Hyposmocoma kahamanoa]|uniref:solute carrier family 22 member 7-like isoform X5 n=1 Tax=Hyposmocoma kahamanoa TaxID=1477025 RepID=UPI000E6D62B6|nr:solute carrier family 22 member 7-like isoform X5 [Hyposmocoma kahamanoa]
MGPAGKFQLRNFSLILVPVIVMAMYNGQYIFNAAKPNNQRCMVRECENTPPVFKTGEWKTWAIPDDPQKARCFRYANQEGQCKKESFSKDLMKCDSWLYEDYNSIVAEFDLGCQEWKRTLVGTIHGLGLMTALAFIGTLSDLCGRRYTFIVTSSLPSVLGIVRGLSNSYYMYLAFEYLEALVASGSYSTGYILDHFGRKKTITSSYLISATALTIMPFIINMGPFPTIMVLVAKMFISIVFSATYLYVTELTPTEVRHTMMGLSLFIGRLGKSSAPLSPLLLQVTPYLPYAVFSAAAWIAAALTHWTPETHNMKMPQTLQEAEHLEPGSSFLALQEHQLSCTKHEKTAEHKQS